MKNSLLILSLALSNLLFAQPAGSIVGTVLDKDLNNEPLPFANILIPEVNVGTTSDFDGLFALDGLAEGDYLVNFSFVGYETQKVPVTVVGGKVTEIQVSLASSSSALDEVIVTTVARRDSQTALLIEQKKAVNFKQQIGAEELTQKGIGDAADAVIKTSGVSKAESGSIYVRGLGDRYNMSSYNGFVLPSNDPSLKNIALDLFRSDIVESIAIDKTYNVDNFGDYAGASININALTSKSKNYYKLSIGSGFNQSALDVDSFYLGQGPGYSGFYNNSYPNYPLERYNFDTGFNREQAFDGVSPTNISGAFEASYGRLLTDVTRVNLFAMASFDNDFSRTSGVNRGSISKDGLIYKDFDFTTYQYDTNTTAMLNLAVLNPSFSVTFSNLLINSSSQNLQEYNGVMDIFDFAPEGGGFIQRHQYKQTLLLVNQVFGQVDVLDKLSLIGGASYSQSLNLIPDRRQITLSPTDWDDPNSPKTFANNLSNGDSHRYYQNLFEDELGYRAKFVYDLQNREDEENNTKLSLGFVGRRKTVDFDATQINHAPRRNIAQPTIDDVYDTDSYFNQGNLSQGLFELITFRGRKDVPNALAPQTYGGEQNITAGYISADHNFSESTKIQVGLRYENIKQSISWSTTLDPTGDTSVLDEVQWLPSLFVLHKLNDANNIRFAASSTYTLPQYKEKAFFQFEEVTQVYLGNPALYASTNYNFDLKWEQFPSIGELVSVTAFSRIIKNPINDVSISSASNDLSYVNSGDQATVFGLEFELVKDLYSNPIVLDDRTLNRVFRLNLNASYMQSKQDLDGEKVLTETAASGLLNLSVDFTNTEDRITGASDVLLNADFLYERDFRNGASLVSSLSANYFSDKLYALGVLGKGNIVDKGLITLNFVSKLQLNELVGLSVSAKNLLNPSYQRIQDIQNVTVLEFNKGRSLSLGVNLTF